MNRPIILGLRTLVLLLLIKPNADVSGWKYFFAPRSFIRLSKKGRIKWDGKGWLENDVLLDVSGGELSIGHNVFINRNAQIVVMERVDIGSDCIIANNVSIYDHDHNTEGEGAFCKQGFVTAPVRIEDNVWIGSNSVILKGVTIGSNSVIAAGAVVTKDVPSGEVWGGVPARFIKKVLVL